MPANQQTNFDSYDKQASDWKTVSDRETVIAEPPDLRDGGTSSVSNSDTTFSATVMDPAKIIEFPKAIQPKTSSTYFKTLNEWEGYIISRDGQSFRARLRDLTNPGLPYEEIVLSVDDITNEDEVAMAEPGAVFYLKVGYDVERKQRVRSAYLYFRRTTVYTNSEIEKVSRSAAKFVRTFGPKKG